MATRTISGLTMGVAGALLAGALGFTHCSELPGRDGWLTIVAPHAEGEDAAVIVVPLRETDAYHIPSGHGGGPLELGPLTPGSYLVLGYPARESSEESSDLSVRPYGAATIEVSANKRAMASLSPAAGNATVTIDARSSKKDGKARTLVALASRRPIDAVRGAQNVAVAGESGLLAFVLVPEGTTRTLSNLPEGPLSITVVDGLMEKDKEPVVIVARDLTVAAGATQTVTLPAGR